MSQQAQPPVKTFRAGRGIEVAVWRNETEQDGRTAVNHLFRVQKRRRDNRTGEWKNSSYVLADDIPRLILVLYRAFEWSTLTESEETEVAAT